MGDCHTQLALILNSTDFDATDREHRFLRYVVEETLAGRGDRIKAYSIAVEVFGRGEAFDPQSDPIVRIEAGHLRRALERYYLTSGQNDPILITIPKGGYVPNFSRRPQPPAAPSIIPVVPLATAKARVRRISSQRLLTAMISALLVAGVMASAWWWTSAKAIAPETPRVLVESFENLAGTDAAAAIASGLKEDIVGQLSKFRDIVVMESAGKGDDPSISPPRFVLDGSVNLSVDSFHLQVRLVNQADDSILWANSYDGAMKVADLIKAQADIAGNVATTLAQIYGVIFQADANRHVENPPDDWAAYSCTLSFYAYRIDVDPETRVSARTCLEKAVGRFPNYATAWGLLSLIYTDDYRFEYEADSASLTATLQRALAAARRAVEIDPVNIRGRQGEMLALYFNNEIDAALRVGKQTLDLNPNDTELMGEYGERLAVSGNWHDGCPLIAEARQRNPGSSAYYESDLAFCAYFSGDYSQAAMWIGRTPAPSNADYHLIRAAIFGEGGNKIEADRDRIWLEKNVPDLMQNMRQVLSTRLGRSQDVDFVIGSLKKAGLKIEG